MARASKFDWDGDKYEDFEPTAATNLASPIYRLDPATQRPQRKRFETRDEDLYAQNVMVIPAPFRKRTEVGDLIEQCIREIPSNNLDGYLDAALDPDALAQYFANDKLFVAVINNKFEGLVGISGKTPTFVIDYFYVTPAFRGRGIGHKLMAKVKQIVRDGHVSSFGVVRAKITTHDETIVAFLKAEGFEVTNAQPASFDHSITETTLMFTSK